MSKKLKKGVKSTMSLPIEVKGIDADNYTLTMVASTQREDRHGDIVMQDGWDLGPYKKNPVILNSHNYNDATEVIAKATKTWIEGKGKSSKLMQEWKFAVDENPKAKIIFDLYAGGFLHASSVGFIPLEFDEKDFFTIKRAELLEVSAVSVPANSTATLAKSIGVDKAELEEALHIKFSEGKPEKDEDEIETEEPEKKPKQKFSEGEPEDKPKKEDEPKEDPEPEVVEDEETEEVEPDPEEQLPEVVDMDTEKSVKRVSYKSKALKAIKRIEEAEERKLKLAHMAIGKLLDTDTSSLDKKTQRQVKRRSINKAMRILSECK